uniref:Uncharacterized protein n=1 Tax=Hyaloperonospora arabidopsidis (strain Emoy2) TaxID=559515 RepID=M4BQ03_HYAAE
MAGRGLQTFRAALCIGQRQWATIFTSRSFTAASSPAAATSAVVPTRSADEWLKDIQRLATQDVLIKRSKLSSYLKAVTTNEELEKAKEIMKIYEQKRVDPDTTAVGLFVKKALELNAPDVVLDVLAAKYRIGLFLEPASLNKVLCKFLKDGELDKVFTLHEIGQSQYKVKNSDRTFDILIRAAIAQQDYDKALELLKTAAEARTLQRVTCNHLLFKLKDGEMQDKIEEVAALMKTAGVEPNETTKKILQ